MIGADFRQGVKVSGDDAPKEHLLTKFVVLALVGAGLSGCGGGKDSGGIGGLHASNVTDPNSTLTGTTTPPQVAANSSGVPVIGTSAAAAQPTSTGSAQLIYIPNAYIYSTPPTGAQSLPVADRSPATGTPVMLNYTPGGTSASLTVSGTGNLPGGVTAAGTGVAKNGTGGSHYAAADHVPPTNQFEGGHQELYVSPLQDSRYGFVRLTHTTGNVTQEVIGGYYTGNPTPTTQLPVMATYQGSFYGLVNSGPRIGDAFTGSLAMTANMTQGTVTGKITDLFSIKLYPAGFGLDLTGKITGSTYAGTVAFNLPNGAAAPAPTTSAFNGGFFGPNGGETAGALRMEGQASPTSANYSVVGGFGARRTAP